MLVLGGQLGEISKYDKFARAMVDLVGSDAASIQTIDRREGGLRLVGWHGFEPASADFWARVMPGSASMCGRALTAGERVVVGDVEEVDSLAGSDDLREFRRSRLRAVQSTPVVADDGSLIGMVSTHWRAPHTPTEQELTLIDGFARAAATAGSVPVESADSDETARRQYETAALNQRVLARAENLERVFRDLTGEPGEVTLFCACGQEGCRETFSVPFEVYNRVRASPHRFVVTPGHAAAIDALLVRAPNYEVVELKPEYRDLQPGAG
jgi:hypothetical protein